MKPTTPAKVLTPAEARARILAAGKGVKAPATPVCAHGFPNGESDHSGCPAR